MLMIMLAYFLKTNEGLEDITMLVYKANTGLEDITMLVYKANTQ